MFPIHFNLKEFYQRSNAKGEIEWEAIRIKEMLIHRNPTNFFHELASLFANKENKEEESVLSWVGAALPFIRIFIPFPCGPQWICRAQIRLIMFWDCTRSCFFRAGAWREAQICKNISSKKTQIAAF